MLTLQLFTSSLGSNPRPTRFNAVLGELSTVAVCSAQPATCFMGNIDFIKLNMPSFNTSLLQKCARACKIFFKQYEAEIWNQGLKAHLEQFKQRSFSLVVCQDILLLPLAVAVKNLSHNKDTCKLIFDAREFYPRQREDSFYWRVRWRGLMDYICKSYLPQADVVFTVSPGLAQGYKTEYGIDCKLLPSLSYYHNLSPHSTPSTVRCIHHGAAASGRKLELMIEAFAPLQGKASLDLMLTSSDSAYLTRLKEKTQSLPHVNVIPPVPMPDIVSFISQYDLGVFLLEPNTFNHKHTWPNKLFEFIQARLGVIVSPVPDMAGLVQERQVGVVTEDFTPESLTKAILSLTPEVVDEFKQKSHEAAKELCWEKNDELIRDTISKLVSA